MFPKLHRRQVSFALSASLLVLGTLCGGSVVAAPISNIPLQLQTKAMYTSSSVNVRSGPGSNYKVVRSLAKGTKVTVVSTASGWSADQGRNVSWSKISAGGWIRSDLLTGSNSGGSTKLTHRQRCEKGLDPEYSKYLKLIAEWRREEGGSLGGCGAVFID